MASKKKFKLKKRVKNILIGMCLVFVCTLLSILFYFVCPKFKDITISITNKDVDVNDFLTFGFYKNKSKLLTKNIKYGIVGTQDIELEYSGKKYIVKLNIIDDIKPDVKFSDVQKYVGEQVSPNDFILEMYDHSKHEVIIDEIIDNSKVGNYFINVVVKDQYGNITEKECKLEIKLFNDIIYHELGYDFSVEEIYFNDHKLDIKNLNTDKLKVNKIGEYDISFNIKDKSYVSRVIVRDTKAPILKVKNLTFYTNSEYSIKLEDLISSVEEKSKYTYSSDFDFNNLKLGENKIIINAVDEYKNKSEIEAIIYIKNDDVGPVISGAKDITINKGNESALFAAVSSNDKTDGKCEITYNKDKVDINKVGKYDLVYMSYDKSMNLSKKSVKLTVIPSKEEVDQLFQEFYDKYLKGKDVLEMTKTVRSKIKYKNVRGVDPIYTGLSTMSGSCYVHAAMLNKALDIAGIENHLVVSNGKYHAWVLAKVDGKWRHYDPTPGVHSVGPMTDSQRRYAKGIGNVSWDSSLPKAN